MTEAEWLACDNLREMLLYAREWASERKLLLFACACCERIGYLLVKAPSRAVIDVAKRYADGRAGFAEMIATARDARAVATDEDDASLAAAAISPDTGEEWAWASAFAASSRAASAAARTEVARKNDPHFWACRSRQIAHYCLLFRDIFGNPFRPVAVDPDWLTWNAGMIQQLAEAIYEERRFADLPVLADALEEAGCTNADILDHCRRPGEHVRGCWVVDLLLGKE